MDAKHFLGIIGITVLCFCDGVLEAASKTDFEIAITKDGGLDHSTAMDLYVGVYGAGSEGPECALFLKHLTAYLGFEKRFAPQVTLLVEAPKHQEDVVALFKKGINAALYIQYKRPDEIEWHLYDTQPGSMVCGRRYTIKGSAKDAAAVLAARVIKELMGEDVPFLSKIAYIERDRKNKRSKLCLLDYVCGETEAQPTNLLTSAHIVVAPFFQKRDKRLFLYLSEFTNRSVHFICVDEVGRRYKMFEQGGTNVGIAFSPTEVVYGHSGTIWRYSFNESKKAGIASCIIKEEGTCASPSLMANGDIIYCSAGRIKRFDRSTSKSVVLVQPYAVGPSYSAVTDKIVYSGRVNKVMQLFVYDMKTGVAHQLTRDPGDKVDPTWSPNGLEVACAWQRGNQSRIMIVDVRSGQSRFITPKGRDCAYPAWSPYLQVMS